MAKKVKLSNWKDEVKKIKQCEVDEGTVHAQFMSLLPICKKLGFENVKYYIEDICGMHDNVEVEETQKN